jgi:hypothetical protein
MGLSLNSGIRIRDDRQLETEHAGYWGKSSAGHFAGGVTANRRACP